MRCTGVLVELGAMLLPLSEDAGRFQLLLCGR